MHAQYTTRPLEDGLVSVSYTLEVPRFYMEFYYDPFSGQAQRRFTYPLQSAFAIDSLTVRVQEPRRARGFELVPTAEQVMQDDQGLDYDIIHFADLAAGVRTSVTVSYTKDDRQPLHPASQAVDGRCAGEAQDDGSSPWRRARAVVLAVLAAGFFAMGVYRQFFRTPAESASGATARRTRRSRNGAPPAGRMSPLAGARARLTTGTSCGSAPNAESRCDPRTGTAQCAAI